jgi:RNA polymerase sigma-70 factor (ECF subfamily)
MDERTQEEWLTGLIAGDPAVVADLRAFLLRGLLRGLAGKADASLVEDFAQEAVLKVLARLSSFRGEGKFLTWALAVGMRVAFSELRKARWKDVSLDALPASGRAALEPAALAPDPAEADGKQALLSTLRRLIATVLTDRQRAVILAELEGVPQAVLVERLGTNRNALYKVSHDARMKLRQGLLDAGVTAEEVRAALTEES